MSDEFDRWQQVTALARAWLAAPDLDRDVDTAAMAFRHTDDDADRFTRGLCDGYAHDLEGLEMNAAFMVAQGEALGRLVAHVKATNPRARRRASAAAQRAGAIRSPTGSGRPVAES